MSEGLSVVDLFRAFRHSAWLLVVVPVVCGAATLVVCLVMPKAYTSRADVSLTVSSQQMSNQIVTNQLLAGLPSPAALAVTFTQQLGTRTLARALDVAYPPEMFRAAFDDKKGLLTLTATGRTPEEARLRADRLLRAAQNYLQERIAAAATANLRSAVAQAKLDLSTAEKGLQEVRAVLRDSDRRSSPASPTLSAALEAQHVDPQYARSPNPAYTFLSLQQAQLQAQLAQAQSRAQSLESVLNDREMLFRLVGQSLQVQVLAPPSEPLRPTRPRPLLYLTVALLGGLVLALLLALLRDALDEEGPASPPASGPATA
jgi:LPS O-antigen subunit length determinant protein (WzzB/FepE family)